MPLWGISAVPCPFMHPFEYPCESPNLCQVALAGRQQRFLATVASFRKHN